MRSDRSTSPGTLGTQRSAGPLASMLVVVMLGGATAGWGTVSALADRSGPLTANAHAARTTSVREAVRASNVSHQGNSVINDRGRGTGTFSCAAQMQVKVSYTKGTTRFTCTTSVGSVVASGAATFFASGTTATFTGTMTILSGTGRYAHAKGKLRVEGTMQRKTFYVEASVSGMMTY